MYLCIVLTCVEPDRIPLMSCFTQDDACCFRTRYFHFLYYDVGGMRPSLLKTKGDVLTP